MNEIIEVFSSGAQILDNILGGGWPVGSIISIEGDPSTGKTLLVLEAIVNHLKKWPDSYIGMTEIEPSFNMQYVTDLGIPIDEIDFWEDIRTIEAWHRRVEKVIEEHDPTKHALVVLDSLDSLSDESELARDIGEGSYGGNKPKKASESLRRIAGMLEKSNVTTMVVSQLRDVLNSPVPMKSSSGGRAITFYNGIRVRLTTQGKIKKTIKGVERIIGIEVRAQCSKNKLSRPFRECKFKLLFEYGIDDLTSNLEWLLSVKEFGGLDRITPLEGKDLKLESQANITNFVKKVLELPDDERQAKMEEVTNITKEVWAEVEENFTPKVKKY